MNYDIHANILLKQHLKNNENIDFIRIEAKTVK